MYQSTKTYGHEVGMSCAFRQWKANSHCNKLHGYALSFTFTFEADELDWRNWVVDFGGLKDLKATLQAYFDHKTVVAADDPHIDWFDDGADLGVIDLIVLVDGVGCEKFAKLAFGRAKDWLESNGCASRVKVVSVEVKEHGANSAIYKGEMNG